MTLQQDIRFYLWAMRCFGLYYVTCTDQEEAALLQRVTPRNEAQALAALLATQSAAVAMLAYFTLHVETFHLPAHSNTGNVYLIVNFGLSCGMVSLLSGYFYAKRRQHARIVQQLLPLLAEHDTAPLSRWRMPFVYAGLSLLSWLIHTIGFRHGGFRGQALAFYVAVFSLSFMLCGLVVMQFTWVRHVLVAALRRWNGALLAVGNGAAVSDCDYYERVRRVLLRRNELLRLCNDEINCFYGSIILLITSFILFSAPSGFFYLISVVFSAPTADTLQWSIGLVSGLLWNAPWLVVIGITMTSGDVSFEVSHTKRLLLHTPSRKCPGSVRKMLEQLLWKSLRPRPILTAYGFFAINRRALFQLFTATLTYAVILVQFMEMESAAREREQSAALH